MWGRGSGPSFFVPKSIPSSSPTMESLRNGRRFAPFTKRVWPSDGTDCRAHRPEFDTSAPDLPQPHRLEVNGRIRTTSYLPSVPNEVESVPKAVVPNPYPAKNEGSGGRFFLIHMWTACLTVKQPYPAPQLIVWGSAQLTAGGRGWSGTDVFGASVHPRGPDTRRGRRCRYPR